MLFRSVVRSKAAGRLVKSWIIISSELFTCKTPILRTFCIKKRISVFLMSVEVIVVNKDAFQYIACKIMPEALTYIFFLNLKCFACFPSCAI